MRLSANLVLFASAWVSVRTVPRERRLLDSLERGGVVHGFRALTENGRLKKHRHTGKISCLDRQESRLTGFKFFSLHWTDCYPEESPPG